MPAMPDAPDPRRPFDPVRKRLQRARAARGFDDAAFLHARVAEDLADRLEAVNRRFERAVILGGGSAIRAALSRRSLSAKLGGFIQADPAPGLLGEGPRFACDPERLPVAAGALDLIVSPLLLHWTNDLPGALVQARLALKPDGLLIGALFGAETLQELRAALLEAEAEVTGGAAMRVAPFPDVRDLAGLLQRAGFALPVTDVDRVRVRYGGLGALLQDLRGMGETAALAGRAPALRRAVLARAAQLYAERFSDPDGRLIATFEILYLTGWSPHESQQKPLRPGSAKARLADALGVKERTAEDPEPV